MSKLNEKTEATKKIIHLLVTSLCARNCKHCCNKQYSLDDVPYVTNEELKEAETLCITGGEPFLFSNPESIARYYKYHFPNIKRVYVYTNALELSDYLVYKKGHLDCIDGVNVSIKNERDLDAFDEYIYDNEEVLGLSSNLLYIFNGLTPDHHGNFKFIQRDWQEDFEAANDSIFRKV